MSAFIISNNHALLIAIAHLSDYTHGGDNTILKYPRPFEVIKEARALLAENIKSVNHRYPDNENFEETKAILSGLNIDEKGIKLLIHRRAAIDIIKQIHCYTYQSCEHDGWETSWSYATCKETTDKLIPHIAGYESASWGIE